MERLVSGKTQEEDIVLDTSLRPKRLGDFVGQERIKESLHIVIAAAQGRKETVDHILLYGPPGLGKTTLACIIAAEVGVNVKVTSGPAIEHPGHLATLLSNLYAGDILFIDEIHRLTHVVEEKLYPAMEDFCFDMMVGKGPGASSLRIHLPHFTLIGATTRFAMVSPPLRDRFGAVYRLDYYDQHSVETIIRRSASILNVEMDAEGVAEIACRARGTPRVANRLLKRARDYAQVMAEGRITKEVAEQAMARFEVDHIGLEEIDHKVLRTIISKFDGGPVGLETIAAAVNEDADTVMDIYEPYLLQLGFLERTPRGRVATNLAYQHLGLTRKEKQPPQRSMW